jgi:hypothetical protein
MNPCNKSFIDIYIKSKVHNTIPKPRLVKSKSTLSRSFAGVTIALIAPLLLLVDAREEVVLLVVLATAVVLKEELSSFLTTTNVPFIL